MLNKTAFANSLALLVALFYLVLYSVSLVAPDLFSFIFNAQFLGANVASLLPKEFSFSKFIGTLVALAASSWIFGFVWAWLYNRLAYKKLAK